jgi:hypothetical protein
MILRPTWKKRVSCCKLAEKIASRINFELAQIDSLFDLYCDLFAHVKKEAPDLIELTAIASVLHSFYNGLENIFLSIAKGIDRDVPAGPQWHRDLLVRMTESMPDRAPVISAATAQRLADYMAFRHFYRHSYSFLLDWPELEKLVVPLVDLWGEAKTELEHFRDSLV